jgi:AcrR family transcriptional regulator
LGKPSAKAKAKRREILSRVLDKLANVDFDSMTIKMICDAADISYGSFYHYFSEKSDLIFELFSQIDDHIVANIIPKLRSEDELTNYVDFCHDISEYMVSIGPRLISSLYPNLDAYYKKSGTDELARPFFSELRKILAKGQMKGQISKQIDEEQIAYMTVAILRGFCFDWTRHNGRYDLVDYCVQFARLFIESLRSRA